MSNKSEAFKTFKKYKVRAENLTSNSIYLPRLKALKTNNAKELISKKFEEYFGNLEITHELSSPYNPKQNSLIERPNRTLISKVRAMLEETNLPKDLQGKALLAAIYIYNRTPHSSLGFKSPYEIRFNKKPNYTYLKSFSSITYYKRPNPKKLESRSKKAILIGYTDFSNYKLLDLESNRAIYARDVKILEGQYLSSSNRASENVLEYKELEDKELESIELPISNSRDSKDSYSKGNLSSNNISPNLEESLPSLDTPLDSREPTIEKDMPIKTLIDDREEDKLALAFLADYSYSNPITYKEAIISIYKDKQLKSIQSKIDNLNKLKTQDLVDLPKDRVALKGRQVYKTKRDPYSNLIKYKSRQVVKGFKQVLGIDFYETFSNTYRSKTWRSLFYKVAYKDLEIEQLDVKLAFLNSPIDKEMFVKQPTSFIDPKYPNRVCCLNIALYSLKQASR